MEDDQDKTIVALEQRTHAAITQLAEQETIAGGWSHVPYALKYDREHPDAVATRIAKTYIKRIDKALRAKGYAVATAVEVEATLGIDPELSISARDRVRDNFTKYANDRQREGWRNARNAFPLAKKTVEKCIIETGKDEVEFTTIPARPLQTAIRAAHIKQRLFEANEEGLEALRETAKTPDALAYSSAEARRMAREINLHNVRFKGCDDPHTLHGEHINVSVHRVKQADQPISWELMDGSALMRSKNFTRGFGRFLMKYGFNDHLLLSSGEESDTRLNKRYRLAGDQAVEVVDYLNDHGSENALCHIFKSGLEEGHLSYVRIQGKGERRRIEWRVPDAHCNPYLAMLHTMANLYAYIEAHEKDQTLAYEGKCDAGVAAHTVRDFFNDVSHAGHERRFRDSLVLHVMRELSDPHDVAEQREIDRFGQAVRTRSANLYHEKSADRNTGAALA